LKKDEVKYEKNSKYFFIANAWNGSSFS